jgi:hypothetical protein
MRAPGLGVWLFASKPFILGGLIAALLILPAAARAQSAIAGVVRDASSAVLPGVTVEASSPALIEKARTATTDGVGVYRVENLPPGTYTVVFTLPGFTSVRREGLELPSSFTATVNAEMRLGGIEETVLVTGESPVVDVSSTSKTAVVDREMLDVLPTGRTAQTAGALIHTTVMGSVDVGGSGSMAQNNQTTAGMAAGDMTVTLDGTQLNGFCGDGSTQSYANPQNYEEIVFESSSAGADFSAGGIRQHLIPRRGGNTFSGSFGAFYMHPSWQGDAQTPELVAAGLPQGNKMDGLNDIEGGAGGKIIRDRFWYFGAIRRSVADRVVPNAYYADGSPGVQIDRVQNYSLRLTGQLDRRNQLSGYYDWVVKDQLLGIVPGIDVGTVARPSKSTPYVQAQAKWTSTVTSRLLVEVGATTYQAYRQTKYQPGVYKNYFTPEWYATANRTDTTRGTQTTAAAAGHYILEPVRRFVQGSMAYVTGSHNMKFGVQNNFGYSVDGTERNADLNQRYQNGVPVQVQIYNTPVRTRIEMNQNVGLYAQDSWTLKRVTLNAGIRWESYQASIGRQQSGEGRFVPARDFPGEALPKWTGWAPRFGAVYNLFGDGKTALKFSVNKFQAAATAGLADVLNPVREQNVIIAWNDLDRDDIADGERGCVYLTPGCEINLAQVPLNFGVTTAGCSTIYTPTSVPCGTDQVSTETKRGTSWHYNVSIQHELLPRVSVTAGYVRADFYNHRAYQNILQSFADYTPVQIANPLDGSAITMYNVSREKLNQVRNVLIPRPERERWNNSFDAGFNARLGGGLTIFGGMLVHQTLEVNCDAKDNPNLLLYCDQSQNGLPWLNQFKVAGVVPLPAGVIVSAAYQNYIRYMSTGGAVWQITPNTRYAATCKGACVPGALVNPGQTVASLNVPLEAPSTRLSERINQLDITVGRPISVGKARVQPELAIFNALNCLAVYGLRSLNYDSTTFLQPSTVVQPRLFRVGLQVKW